MRRPVGPKFLRLLYFRADQRPWNGAYGVSLGTPLRTVTESPYDLAMPQRQ